MIEELFSLMADLCYEQAEELAEEIIDLPNSTPQERQIAASCLRQIAMSEEAEAEDY